MATEARMNPKTGIPEHKHPGGSGGWHWASAGHRDDGQIHKTAEADKPTFVEGTTDEQKEHYGKAFRREDGFVSKIPSKAKDKTMPAASGDAETQTIEGGEVAEMPKEVANGTPPAASAQRPRPTANAR